MKGQTKIKGVQPMHDISAFSASLSQLVSDATTRVGLLITDQGRGTCWAFGKNILVTNAHVVDSLETKDCRVRLNGRLLSASIVGLDERTDIAVIRVKETMEPLSLKLDAKVGELCLAVGNPFGHVNSVSMGIVSGLHRSREAAEGVLEDLVQTDAAINYGNSGGPLISVNGDVIGMCTMSMTQAEAMHYAVSAQTLAFIVPILLKKRKIAYASMGVVLAEQVDPDGSIAVRVIRPFIRKTSLKVRDSIVQIGDRKILRRVDVLMAMAECSEGESLSVIVQRDGISKRVSVENLRD